MDEHTPTNVPPAARTPPVGTPTMQPPPPKRGPNLALIMTLVLGGLVVLVGLPCGALVVGITLPAIGAARQAARQTMSQSNLAMIHGAMAAYAQEHAGAYPPAESWADVLVEGGWLAQGVPTSAASDGVGVDYFYVPPGPAGAAGPRRVLLYEDPAHYTEGVPVLFTDGTMTVAPHEEFDALVRAAAPSEP